jgi:O-antigen/teichoic acid export membrane protein
MDKFDGIVTMLKKLNFYNKIFPKSNFTKHVLILVSGTVIAQAISILVTPILTRLYTPEEFGLFAIFVAISSVLGSIANGRFELALLLPKVDKNAFEVFKLGLIINIVYTCIILLQIVFRTRNITRFLIS